MTDLLDNKDSSDSRNNSSHRRRTNENSKAAICKDVVCDRRDMKLKEAEKTIANKDVIIKMLQEHVKKLEESYKQNLRETEDFRYKFCLASEQVKRLRACPKINDKKDKEKEIKELRSDLAKWKQQCDELMNTKERCLAVNGSGKCSYNVQKVKNFEKFMRAHYDLLHTLVEKIAEKSSCAQMEAGAIDETKKVYNEQIKMLQDEVDRLKLENAKLQEPAYVPVETNRFSDVKDSVLETIRRSRLESGIKEDQSLPEASLNLDQEAGSDSRRVSFDNKTDSAIDSINEEIHEPTGDVFPNILRKESLISDNLTNADVTSNILRRESERSDAIKDYIRDSKTQFTKEEIRDSTGNISASVPQTELENICRKESERSEKRKDNIRESKAGSIGDISFNVSPRESEKIKNHMQESTNADVSSNMSRKEFGKPKLHMRESKTGSAKVEIQEPVAEVSSNTHKESEERFEPTSISEPLSCACTTDEDKILQDTNIEDTPGINETDATSIEKEKLEIDAPNQDVEKQPEVTLSTGNDSVYTPKPDIDEIKGAINGELTNVTSILNEIRDRVTELVQKQSGAANELQLLKTELLTSQESKLHCDKQISLIKDTLDDHKQTFLINFEEHKIVSNNLSQVSEKIQAELNELKTKMETLCLNLTEMKSHMKTKLRSSSQPSESDELITIEECQYEILQLNKRDDNTLKSVGVPTIYSQDDQEKNEVLAIDSNKESLPQNYDKLEEQYSKLHKKSKQKDQQIKCINALISCYTKAQNDIRALHPRKSGTLQNDLDEHVKRCKCDNADVHKYIEKVKSENHKLKVTISSVIDHLNEKMKQIGQTPEAASSRFCLCMPMDENRNDSESYRSDDSSICSTSVVAEAPNDTHLQIEDIYNVVRRTCAPATKQRAATKFKPSSSSCFCNRNVKSSYTCCCDGSLTSDPDINIEDIYNSVLCACGTIIDSTRSNVILCESKRESISTVNAPAKKNEGELCPTEVCQGLDQCSANVDKDCSGQSLMSNLQTYVNYLHEQLDIISSIENRIEDLRVDIKTPKM